jgi:hypothetical protein
MALFSLISPRLYITRYCGIGHILTYPLDILFTGVKVPDTEDADEECLGCFLDGPGILFIGTFVNCWRILVSGGL